MDAGDLALTDTFSIKDMTAPQVFDLALQKTKILLNHFFSNAPKSFTTLTPQVESLATYCHKIKKKDGLIQREDSIHTVSHKVKAFFPWPGTYVFIDGQKYDLIEVRPFQRTDTEPASKGFSNGTLTVAAPDRLLLHLHDGCLQIQTLQKQGKKALPASLFLKGCRLSFPVRID